MPDKEDKKLAFGVEPSPRLYRLRLARYQGLAEAVADWLARQDGGTPEARVSAGREGFSVQVPQFSVEGRSQITENSELRTVNSHTAGTLHKPDRPRRFRLLDVGVGSGRSMRYLEHLDISDRFEFIGLDNSTYRLTYIYQPLTRDAAGPPGDAARPSRVKGHPPAADNGSAAGWTLLQADVTRGLPLENATFDVVLCEQVLEHIEGPEALLAEIHRVLRPGGLLIAGVPTFPPGIDTIRRRLVPLLDRATGRSRSHVNVFTRRSFQHLVGSAAAFDIFDVRGFRIISGGLLAPLEDHAWWYRLNRRIGRAVPALCTEIQILARRR